MEFRPEYYKEFDSSVIRRAGYDSHTGRLYIEFSNGHKFSYGSVSVQEWMEFVASDSAGMFYNVSIKNLKNSCRLLDDWTIECRQETATSEGADKSFEIVAVVAVTKEVVQKIQADSMLDAVSKFSESIEQAEPNEFSIDYRSVRAL